MSVPQLLKWIGNKTKYASQIVSYMPNDIHTYYEPFLGGAAVLGELCRRNQTLSGPHYENAIGNDILTPLMQIYEGLVKTPDTLVNYYQNVVSRYYKNREKVYLEIRDKFNEERDYLDFMVLTRTCYSGIIRFRKSDGYMSTPIGPHNPIKPEKFACRVDLWNKLLKNVEFQNRDFRETMQNATMGDLVYCDPPYTHSQSILYGAQNFNIADLWTAIRAAKDRGAMIMLSLNGKNKSKTNDISVRLPEGLFERYVYIDCGISMINRLQSEGQEMINEEVHDLLLFTW